MFRIAGMSGLAAAIALMVIAMGSLLLVPQNVSYGFEDVLDNIKKSKAVIFTNKQRFGNQPEFEFTWHVQGERIRMEYPEVMVQIADFEKKKGIQLNRSTKTAKLLEITKGTAKVFANPLQQVSQVKSKSAKKIAREKIGQNDVDVYLVEKIDFMGIKGKGEMKLWVDPKTQLPVRIRIGVNTRQGAKETDRPFDTQLSLENFSWHDSLDESLFDLEVPKGYTLEKK